MTCRNTAFACETFVCDFPYYLHYLDSVKLATMDSELNGLDKTARMNSLSSGNSINPVMDISVSKPATVLRIFWILVECLLPRDDYETFVDWRTTLRNKVYSVEISGLIKTSPPSVVNQFHILATDIKAKIYQLQNEINELGSCPVVNCTDKQFRHTA